MSTTTFQPVRLSTQPSGVPAALHALWLATRQLAHALWQISVQTQATPRVKSTFEEAEDLRRFASSVQAQDPEFAQDLFAAANRHESGVA